MSSNWSQDRGELLQIAADLVVNRDYGPIEAVAETMARLHYRGVCKATAAGKFAKALKPLVVQVVRQKWEAEQQELAAMEGQLVAEGWRWVDSGDGSGCWWHGRVCVNRMGGTWPSKSVATRVTFASATRAWFLDPNHESGEA